MLEMRMWAISRRLTAYLVTDHRPHIFHIDT